MKHNPFVPREQRTAILTFDNGQRVRAEISIPGTDKPVWHTELERRIVNDFNKALKVLENEGETIFIQGNNHS